MGWGRGRSTYGSSSGHRPEQAVVDLDHLLDRLAGNPVPRCGSRVRRDDDTALKSEG